MASSAGGWPTSGWPIFATVSLSLRGASRESATRTFPNRNSLTIPSHLSRKGRGEEGHPDSSLVYTPRHAARPQAFPRAKGPTTYQPGAKPQVKTRVADATTLP